VQGEGTRNSMCHTQLDATHLRVPTVLVVLCVACCRITRDKPKSASFASAPYGAVLQLLTSTLRAFTATAHAAHTEKAWGLSSDPLLSCHVHVCCVV
jgi:hypothetical protein